jgi:hypothetical protein
MSDVVAQNISWASKYGKTVTAFLFTLYTVLVPLISGDHKLDGGEWVVFAIAVGNNLLVYIIPMSKSFASSKTVINSILAALAMLQTVLGGGIDMNEVALIIGAALAVLGVNIAPAFSPNESVKVDLGPDKPRTVVAQ